MASRVVPASPLVSFECGRCETRLGVYRRNVYEINGRVLVHLWPKRIRGSVPKNEMATRMAQLRGETFADAETLHDSLQVRGPRACERFGSMTRPGGLTFWWDCRGCGARIKCRDDRLGRLGAARQRVVVLDP